MVLTLLFIIIYHSGPSLSLHQPSLQPPRYISVDLSSSQFIRLSAHITPTTPNHRVSSAREKKKNKNKGWQSHRSRSWCSSRVLPATLGLQPWLTLSGRVTTFGPWFVPRPSLPSCWLGRRSKGPSSTAAGGATGIATSSPQPPAPASSRLLSSPTSPPRAPTTMQ
uniref:Aldehyde reductase II-like protein n=1 Tax=Pyricularia grisea TaxID=148305 RepID=Q5EMT4_PYRGI|nr:aldehyde reductase II-like protein [Pyricularia grisea]